MNHEGAAARFGRGLLVRALQGALIGLGAVLPGVSGGVLCVVFGVYQPMMEVLSEPRRALGRHFWLLAPVCAGAAAGFLGVARLLGFLLDRYPGPSVCLFVGLIAGMLPSLYRQAGAQGRGRSEWIALAAAFAAALALLLALRAVAVQLTPGPGWYLFCGFCLALSVIVPGMSFSTLLMPLGLYAPFLEGIGRFDPGVILPGGLGAAATLILLSRAAAHLMQRRYSVMFHAIIGVIAAATIVIIPGFAGVRSALVNAACAAAGAVCALALARLNAAAEGA